MLKFEKDYFFEQKFLENKLNTTVCAINRKEASLKSAPKMFSPSAKKIIVSKIKEKNCFFQFRNFYKKYLGSKHLLKPKTFRKYLSSNLFPVTLLRALSIYLKDQRLLKKIITNRIINNKNQKITVPLSKKELLNPKLAYLCGVIFGYVYINKNLIKINDGFYQPKQLLHSQKFLNNVGKLFHQFFNKKPTYLKQRGSHFELAICSKEISKFFTFFLSVPLSPKKRLKIPKIYKTNKKCLKMFLRGLFDTDGSVHYKYNYITFKSKDKLFAKEVKNAIKFYRLSPSNLFLDNLGISEIRIYARDTKKFFEEIGFSHPRKKGILQEHINKGIKSIVFIGLKKNSFFKNYVDITKINELRIKGLGEKLKEIRTKQGLNQKEFSRKLKIKRRNYARFEINKLAAPIKIFIKLLGKKKFFETIAEKKAKFGLKGHNFVKLKLNINKSDSKLFEYLLPKKSKVFVVQRHPKGLLKNHGIEKEIEKNFDVKIIKDSDQKVILSKTLAKYLKTFCIYKNLWEI